MVFSRLLLAAANSKKYISGERSDDKVVVNTHDNEVVLCFQIDDKENRISGILDFNEKKRCDGLIFYSKDGEESKVICLVEMKSSNIDNVVEQIDKTKRHIEQMLRAECGSHCNKLLSRVKWKAGFYSFGASDDQKKRKIKDQLKKTGFDDVTDFDRSKNDAGPFLRGELTVRNLKSKYKDKRR
jgi:hypothetical protein